MIHKNTFIKKWYNILKLFFLYIRITNNYYKKKTKKKNRENLQKEAHERYQNLSEEEKYKKLQNARERYKNLCEEEKEKKHQCGRKRYKNLLENEKQRLVGYI